MTRLLLMFLSISIAMTTAVFSAERPQRSNPGNTPSPSAVPAILSIIPAQAEPGGKVMIFGSGFGDSSKVFLGSVEIPAKISDGKQVEFSLPGQLLPGLYALYLRRADGAISRPYNFTVLSPRPVLNGLSPDQVSACAQGRDREVTAQGQNFNDKSLLLFDGAGIKSRFISSEAIAFSVPQVSGGLHQVQVHNPPENSSIPLALTIETRPEISQVTQGNDHVSYYELIIDGRNFQQNSSLYVDGQRIGGRGGLVDGQREQLIYVDCTRLVYQRHPYSSVNKDFQIQVVNTGGEASQMVNVSAP
ncbi:MAG: IPT/TIG domain-containing protein [Desulfuromonadales bacterium]|nr:IPT/TIG domain-containing protein [Desulfuromonadales bacterium]